MRIRGFVAFVAVIVTAVVGWPQAVSAHTGGHGSSNAAPGKPTEQLSNGAACATGANRPYVRTLTPVLAARQSDPDTGQQSLTTTFVWWKAGGFPAPANQVSQTGGNPTVVTAAIPAGRLVDGKTYVWKARTFDGSRYGQWSAACAFTVDVSAPEPPAGITSTDYSSDSFRGGIGIAGEFFIAAPLLRPADTVAYAWTLDSGIHAAAAPTIAADPVTHGATLTYAPTRDGPNTLRVWSKDRVGLFSSVVTWTFLVPAKSTPTPEPTRPAAPTISFPAGQEVAAGGVLPVRFDANGDVTVTSFNYSIDDSQHNLTAVPDQPGGFVVVEIHVGANGGPYFISAVANTGTITSNRSLGTFEVIEPLGLVGIVWGYPDFFPVAGALVRLEPGGLETVTGADGTFAISEGLTVGELYTITSSAGDCSNEIQLTLEPGTTELELIVFCPESQE